MNLQRVKTNCILVLPETLPEPRYRGGKGFVVDLDAPCEAEWCKGQEWKLEPAPKDSKPGKQEHPIALRLIAAEEKRRADAASAPPAKADAAPQSGDEDLEVKSPARARKAS